MASTATGTPSLTPSRSPSPELPVQPDHFYGSETQLPASPNSDGRTWLDPEDDPLAQRGIPVFKPTVDEFRDFEAYMNRVERWGSKSGIVKVIPPKEWTDALPPVNAQLADVKLKNPIEQQMMGRGGLFRQQNIEKRRVMSVREWAELCAKEEWRAPGVDDIGLHARSTNGTVKAKTRRGRRKTREPETAEPEMTPDVMVKEEDEDAANLGISVSRAVDDEVESKSLVSPPDINAVAEPAPVPSDVEGIIADTNNRPSSTPTVAVDEIHISGPSPPPTTEAAEASDVKEERDGTEGGPPKRRGRRVQTREEREAALAERAEKDKVFLDDFDPHVDWLPPNTSKFDYTPEFCKELERRYWRNCGFGKPPWYGADMQGSLFTDETKAWNVGHLESTLSRLLPTSRKGLPGVNTPYLYFGMWRATFAWHVEDMDLFSINYIHFGAPKFWYAVPQARALALEQTMKGYFPKDTTCPQFLRHKSYLASPKVLTQSSCRPNLLVQQEGEFVITYPRGYHAGFNLGFNCAESVNFALDTWLDRGRVAKVCECVDFSVRIDVDQLLLDREAERARAAAAAAQVQPSSEGTEGNEVKPKAPRKRKSDATDGAPRPKRSRTKKENVSSLSSSSPSKTPKVTLKLGPKPQEPEVFPCCLCVSDARENLLRVHNPPLWQKEGQSGEGSNQAPVWYAHEECANVIPETWIDTTDDSPALPDETVAKERMVFGTDTIPKDRWSLKCSACTKTRHKAHGAPIQCTKGKCPKAYHVSCARDGADSGISYEVLREVENDVLLNEPPQPPTEGDVPMDGEEEPRVLALVKKLEVELLCPQHNPVKMEAKKAAKQDRIRNMLLALPPMARIKLRVSAGVFEVSLVRVVEETGSVEVLWDRGLKREFKWSSVVFGNAGNVVVGQKPSEVAPEPEQPPAVAPLSVPVTQQSASTSFYLPLGSSASMEVRSTLTRPLQHYSHPSTPAPEASTSGSTYGQPYKSTYYTPYASTSYQPNTSYPYPGNWTYQYPNQSNTSSPAQTQNVPPNYPAATPQYTAGPPNGQQSYSSNYNTSAYPYHYASGSYYAHPPQQQNSPPNLYPPSQQMTHSHYPPTQSQVYPQYAPGLYPQYPAQGATYPQAGPSQRPAYTPPTYQSPQDTSYKPDTSTSRSQTPSAPQPQGLRWQRPYEGPKAPRTASRSSSAQVPSRAVSQSALAFQRGSHEATPESATLATQSAPAPTPPPMAPMI